MPAPFKTELRLETEIGRRWARFVSTRKVVLDTSVVVAAHFPEKFSKQADKIIDAAYRRAVIPFAPELLPIEFLKTAVAKCRSRGTQNSVDSFEAANQVERFFDLGITYVRAVDIQQIAWDLMLKEAIAPPDSWMLACAKFLDAELWVSHDHKDGFVETARRLHSGKIFTLEANRDRLP